jgi:hypothetical protein
MSGHARVPRVAGAQRFTGEVFVVEAKHDVLRVAIGEEIVTPTGGRASNDLP